jgi:S-formylglutathione hydrolase FrmB
MGAGMTEGPCCPSKGASSGMYRVSHAVRLAVALVVLGAPLSVYAALEQFPDGHGIHVETFAQRDDRDVAVRVSTAALQHPVDVRILLPTEYEAAENQARRYPVLYLFHGTSGRASDWIIAGNAAATTAGVPLIVVMPDCGFNGDGGGWFANWYNGGAGGPPMWETFHIEQLVPWIDANLRTIATRSGRAVAGLSQGGFGSLSYAARHPDLFTSAAAFSGGCEIDRDPEAIDIATSIIQGTTILSGFDKDAIFGPRATQEINWQAHDPATLVTNLRGMDIELWTGNGEVGPLEVGPPDAVASAIELITFGATRLFHGHLDEARIPHAYNYYGGGTHIWAYWARDLEEYMAPLMDRFDNPPPPPHAISYLSAADEWEHWGWRVSLERPERAFSQLRYARRSGFVLTGSGRADVRTPAFFAPGTRVRVLQRGPGLLAREIVTADAGGRLHISVAFGDGSRPRTTRVSLHALERIDGG